MKLVWAQYALEDRRAIYDHIEADDARAAALVDGRIATAVAQLIDFPLSNRAKACLDGACVDAGDLRCFSPGR